MKLTGRNKRGRGQKRLMDVVKEDKQRVGCSEYGEMEADDPL